MRGKGEKNNCQRSKFRVTKLVGEERGGEYRKQSVLKKIGTVYRGAITETVETGGAKHRRRRGASRIITRRIVFE